jgi:putative ABC transport system substrate-binding protein
MRRREVIAMLGGVAAAWPLAARAQQAALPVIGFINSASPDSYADQLRAFRQGLGEAGYVEGRNVTIEYRWAEGHPDRLPTMAADLVRRQVTVIAATTTDAVRAAKAATEAIPIVFEVGTDPVSLGLVASLARPGGNATGATSLGLEVGQKGIGLLHELLPAATVMALLVNPTNVVVESSAKEGQAAARALGLQMHVLRASDERQIDDAFAASIKLGAGALVISLDAFFTSRMRQLAALALHHSMPALYSHSEFAAAGGLLSYGSSTTDSYHLAGVYTGRVLRGEKPADLPVQQNTKLELVINLKTAKALGITVPQSLLVAADQVIE